MAEREHLVSIFKERYDFELDRKKAFDSAISIPITLVSFLVAGIFYTLIDDDLRDVEGLVAIVKWLIVIPMGIACVLTFVQLRRVYIGPSKDYRTLPSAATIDSDNSKLAAYKEAAGPNEPLTIAKMMNDNIIKWYSECSDYNFTINESRGASLKWAKHFISTAFVFGIILMIFIGAVKSNLI